MTSDGPSVRLRAAPVVNGRLLRENAVIELPAAVVESIRLDRLNGVWFLVTGHLAAQFDPMHGQCIRFGVRSTSPGREHLVVAP